MDDQTDDDMDDEATPRAPGQRPAGTEGVRIIGADEAADAAQRGDVAARRSADEPRYGDRPLTPDEGARPTIRFPLSDRGEAAPAGPESDPVIHAGSPAPEVPMPHWTEPATGEVPRIFGDERRDDLDAWASLSGSTPRWRGEGTAYDANDYDDLSHLGDDETRVGALDSRDRPAPDDFFGFDRYDEDEGQPSEPGTRTISSAPRRSGAWMSSTGSGPVDGGAGRDVPLAVGVGLGFGALALLSFWAGPRWAMVLVTAVLGLGALEFFNGLRRGGYQPAVLLGAAGTVSFALAAYYKGEVAYPLVLFLTVVFGLLWYWVVTPERAVINLGVTVLGTVYVGGLGGFAALLLAAPDGTGLLLAAVIPTVAYDVGGFVIGRNAGRAPLTDISPNKTVEGLLGGMLCAVLAAAVIVGSVPGIAPFDDLKNALWLGVVVALAAPLGDLCESLLKRDLGVKDMGDILPGHGGILDRFDALLFVLPSVFYLARILFFS